MRPRDFLGARNLSRLNKRRFNRWRVSYEQSCYLAFYAQLKFLEDVQYFVLFVWSWLLFKMSFEVFCFILALLISIALIFMVIWNVSIYLLLIFFLIFFLAGGISKVVRGSQGFLEKKRKFVKKLQHWLTVAIEKNERIGQISGDRNGEFL